MSSGYNGWKNYETWNIMLWINNDEGINDMIDSNLEEWVKGHTFRSDREDTANHASSMQEYFVQTVNKRELWKIMGMDEAFPIGRTRDDVSIFSPKIDWDEIREAIAERLDSRFVDAVLN